MLGFLNRLNAHQKTMMRNVGRIVGLDIRLNTISARDDLRLVSFLNQFSIKLVLDVGANKGQFASGLFKNGFAGKIVSFEPLPDAYALLQESANKFGDRWLVGPCVALSNQEGTTEFHITEADTSSSLFRPRADFVSATPEVRHRQTIRIPTARLDSVVSQLDLIKPDLFLKLDVQGAESLVLAGAPMVLAAAKGLITELSLTSLYEGQPPARDVLEIIYGAGFEVWDVWQGYRNPKTHRLNQIDLVCFKP